MELLGKEDRQAIEQAIERAEARTSGEIVFTLAKASAHYHHANIQGALAGMAILTFVYLLIPIGHTIAGALWVEFLSFAALLGVMDYLPFRRWLITEKEMEARVYEAAFMQFYSSGLYRTRESNGIEIFLSILERRVVVIADRGIHEKMGGTHWNEVKDMIVDGIRRGKAREGICAAVEDCGEALAKFFPPRTDDINELPNRIIDRPLT